MDFVVDFPNSLKLTPPQHAHSSAAEVTGGVVQAKHAQATDEPALEM